MPPSTDAQGNPTAAQRNPPGFDCSSSWGLRPDSQLEIVELSMSIGSWLAFGRLNRVLGLDAVCTLPSHSAR